MAAQDIHQQWLENYTRVLTAYGLNYQVREYNDLEIQPGDQPRVIIRNTASVVPQRVHMLGVIELTPSEEAISESATAPDRLEAAEFAVKLTDQITRVRGRAVTDHTGQVYIELICVAGEPGLVPTVDQLQEQLPQLLALLLQARQKLG